MKITIIDFLLSSFFESGKQFAVREVSVLSCEDFTIWFWFEFELFTKVFTEFIENFLGLLYAHLIFVSCFCHQMFRRVNCAPEIA